MFFGILLLGPSVNPLSVCIRRKIEDSDSAKSLAVAGAPADDRRPTDLQVGDNFTYTDRKAYVVKFFPHCLVPGTVITEASHYVCHGERMLFRLQLGESRQFTALKEDYGNPNSGYPLGRLRQKRGGGGGHETLV